MVKNTGQTIRDAVKKAEDLCFEEKMAAEMKRMKTRASIKSCCTHLNITDEGYENNNNEWKDAWKCQDCGEMFYGKLPRGLKSVSLVGWVQK